MTSQTYTIDSFTTGLDLGKESWQIPEDGFEILHNAHTHRDNVYKRGGYNDFAFGAKSTIVTNVDTPQCESRVVRKWASLGGTEKTLSNATPSTGIVADPPIRRFSLRVKDSGGAYYYDDGDGGFVNASGAAVGSSSVNYITGDISITVVTPGTTTVANYDTAETLDGATPSTGTMTNLPMRRGGVRVIDDAGNKYYDDGVGGFVDSSGVEVSGATVDYATGEISITVGSASTDTAVDYDYHPADPVMGIIKYYDTSRVPQLVIVTTTTVNKYNRTTNRLDFVYGTLTGSSDDFVSWVSYPDTSENPRVIFTNGKDVIQSYNGFSFNNWAYTHSSITTLIAKNLEYYDNRLFMSDTTENGSRYVYRVRRSGLLGNRDVLNASDGSSIPTGAGYDDIPSLTPTTTMFKLGADLIVANEQSAWSFRRTNSLHRPVTLKEIEQSEGASANFGVLRRPKEALVYSRSGIYKTDGYAWKKFDNRIPDFSDKTVNQTQVSKVYGSIVDNEHLHDQMYLLYPDTSSGISNKMLVYNYADNNWSTYDMYASCYGFYEQAFSETWTSLGRFGSWGELAAEFSSWTLFSARQKEQFVVLGGHHGQVWRFSQEILDDNKVTIRSVTVGSGSITVTTDYNELSAGDLVYIDSTEGLTGVNTIEWVVSSVSASHYTVVLKPLKTEFVATGTHTANTGALWTIVQPQIRTGKFNPYWKQRNKVRLISISALVKTADIGKVRVDVITDDRRDKGTPLSNTGIFYQLNTAEDSDNPTVKRVNNVYINQTGRFIQLEFTSTDGNAPMRIESISYNMRPMGKIDE